MKPCDNLLKIYEEALNSIFGQPGSEKRESFKAQSLFGNAPISDLYY